MHPIELDQLSKELYDEIMESDVVFPTSENEIEETLKGVNSEDLTIDFSNEILAKLNGEIIENKVLLNNNIIPFPSEYKQAAGFYRNKKELSKITENKLELHRKKIVEDLNK